MKKAILILSIFVLGCMKPEQTTPAYNAEIIGYDGRKSYCLYGWMIKIGNDTIMSTSEVLSIVGHQIDTPQKVFIEVGKKEDFCKYPYHDILKLRVCDIK